MTGNIHPLFAEILGQATARPDVFTKEEAEEMDMALYRDKLTDGRGQRAEAAAMKLQHQWGAL